MKRQTIRIEGSSSTTRIRRPTVEDSEAAPLSTGPIDSRRSAHARGARRNDRSLLDSRGRTTSGLTTTPSTRPVERDCPIADCLIVTVRQSAKSVLAGGAYEDALSQLHKLDAAGNANDRLCQLAGYPTLQSERDSGGGGACSRQA
ncbi:MAG TPA: hypothetical protein VFJ93_00735 [Gaiellaceae bacterium]|nr:hypothetical protein [Gaiellaceae bacterium]